MKVKEGVKTPRRATKGSIGYDFYAPRDLVIRPGGYAVFGTGVSFTDEDTVNGRQEWAMLLFPRSGLGFRHGTRLRNTVGVIDCDYRDEIGVSMTADEMVTIKEGEAYMQGIIIPRFTFDNEIEPTEERIGGFGSTDTRRMEGENEKRKRYRMGKVTFHDSLIVMVEVDEDEAVMRERALEEVRRIMNEEVEEIVDGVDIL